MINGQLVLVPIIYFADPNAELRNQDQTGSLMLANNININTRDFDNSGGVIATNNLVVQASNDINNIGGSLISGNDLVLNAGRNINHESLISRDSFGSGYISQKLVKQGKIQSGNVLNMLANNDINIRAADVSSAGNTLINAGNDVNIESIGIRNRYVQKGKYRTEIEDQTVNVSSNLFTGANLAIISGNNINVKASNINVTESALLNAGNQINITSAQDSYYHKIETKKKGSFGRSSSTSTTTHTTTQVGSNIVANKLNLISKDNINIQASILAADNGTLVSQVGNINIKNAN